MAYIDGKLARDATRAAAAAVNDTDDDNDDAQLERIARAARSVEITQLLRNALLVDGAAEGLGWCWCLFWIFYFVDVCTLGEPTSARACAAWSRRVAAAQFDARIAALLDRYPPSTRNTADNQVSVLLLFRELNGDEKEPKPGNALIVIIIILWCRSRSGVHRVVCRSRSPLLPTMLT